RTSRLIRRSRTPRKARWRRFPIRGSLSSAKFTSPKRSQASLEIVDTPGLSRTHEGSAQKLAAIREAGALVMVVAGFGGNDPAADLRNFDDDLLIADLDLLSGRVERLKDQLRKPRANKEKDQEELDLLTPLLAELEAGRSLVNFPMSSEQRKAIKS